MKKIILRDFYLFFRWGGRFCLILFLLWVGGFSFFIWQATPPSSEDKKLFPIKADVIVVLTGGERRIEEGMQLLNQGVAKALFISGVAKGVREKDLVQHALKNRQEIFFTRDTLDLGYKARDTKENAEEIATWIQSFNQKCLQKKEDPIKKVIIVTSAYHMPRSLLEIKKEMPDILFIPYPVYAKVFKEDGWWRKKKTLLFAFMEYNKYIAVEVRILLKRIKIF